MLVRDVKDCTEIIAGDKTILREVLHPSSSDVHIGYSIAQATVQVGGTSAPHQMKTSEVYYILEGAGRMSINEEHQEVSTGQAIYIPPNAIQYIKNTGEHDLVFLCIVDPAWKPEDEIILDNK